MHLPFLLLRWVSASALPKNWGCSVLLYKLRQCSDRWYLKVEEQTIRPESEKSTRLSLWEANCFNMRNCAAKCSWRSVGSGKKMSFKVFQHCIAALKFNLKFRLGIEVPPSSSLGYVSSLISRRDCQLLRQNLWHKGDWEWSSKWFQRQVFYVPHIFISRKIF